MVNDFPYNKCFRFQIRFNILSVFSLLLNHITVIDLSSVFSKYYRCEAGKQARMKWCGFKEIEKPKVRYKHMIIKM